MLATAFSLSIIASLPFQVVGVGSEATALLAVVSGEAAFELGFASIVSGPAAVILIAVAIGVSAGFQAFSQEQTVQDLKNLSDILTQVTNARPDLAAFASDTTGLGTYKLTETFVAQTLGGMPSTAALPVHRPGTDLGFAVAPQGGNAAGSETLTYQDWNGLSWTAQTYGGWFVETCNSGATCPESESMIASIHYVDWSGTKWTASRIGRNFVSTKGAPAATDQACPADEATGVSSVSDVNACLSYVSSSFPLKDVAGNPVTVSLAQTTAFTSSATLNFTTGRNSTTSITVAGSPAPAISLRGSLPAGFTFQPGTGAASLAYTGAPEGTYQMNLSAANDFSSAQQIVTMHVITGLSITSPSTLTGLAGLPVNFLVTTTGDLPISLSIDPNMLVFTGLTFTDNGNGTATIRGTDGSGLNAACLNLSNAPCGITATNATGSVTQAFVINLGSPPQATLVGPATTTFTAGVPNSVRLVSTGAITPVTYWFNVQGHAPSWLSFHDNGDGTGVLSGTPPAGTSGSSSFILAPVALGSVASLTDFTVNVRDTPGFLTPDVARFTAGTFGSFEIKSDGPAVDAGGVTLPAGLTFAGGNPATITGGPAAGTGGTTTVLLTATDSRGTGSQLLTLEIDEAPYFTSPSTATMYVGAKSSFAVTTLGYPSLSTKPNPALNPTSPDQGQGMHFDVEGLPPGFTYTNLNPQGYATGTLTIQGTPTAAGVSRVRITANNGVGTPAQRLLTMSFQETALIPVNGVCNGIYHGTYQGDLHVDAGESCTFVAGGVTGNIRAVGGGLTLRNASVGGWVDIESSHAGFDIEDTKIGGYLSIAAIWADAPNSQVCGSHIGGYLQLLNNPKAIEVGGGNCANNTIDDYVSVQGDTGTTIIDDNTVTNDFSVLLNSGITQIFSNKIGGNLDCVGNSSITGGSNTAKGKLDQCAPF